jgi:Protein of unknown function (DUF3572)
MTKRSYDPRETAEIVAIQALSFVAGDAERLGQFLAETGIGPETLRSAAKDPGFLAGVLDFLLRNEAVLMAFADSSHLEPKIVVNARAALGGPSWERDVP